MSDEFLDLLLQSFRAPSEQVVFRTLVARNPHGFERALEERCLMSWLRVRAERAQGIGAGLSWPAVLAVKSAWDALDDDAPPALRWYDAWRAAGAATDTLLRRVIEA